MRNAKLAAVLLLALTGGASAVLTEADCDALNGYFACAPKTGEPLTEALCDTNYCVWDGSTCAYSPATITAYGALSFGASQTAAEEACTAAADCEGLTMNNTVSLSYADGTVNVLNPSVCESVDASIWGTSCKPELFYYADECMTNGYPFSSLEASAGNSVRPALAFALACVSAAVAAFA
jgi:hypothetical protein